MSQYLEQNSNATTQLHSNSAARQYSEIVQTARDYYNSRDADYFYSTIWGGEDIHIGIYNHNTESIFDASRRTVEWMAESIPAWDARLRVLDIGSGYGGPARCLASTFGCHVTCLNLSETQNRRNLDLSRDQGLPLLIKVVADNFENISLPDGMIDVVWSQDAMLHSGDRARVLAEVSRVLDKGGHFIFTDIMQTDDCSPDAMQPILDRINLSSLGSLDVYRTFAAQAGLEEVGWTDLSPHLATHYTRVLQEVQAHYDELSQVCSDDYLTNMQTGLQYWINGGKSGDLAWGILHFGKP